MDDEVRATQIYANYVSSFGIEVDLDGSPSPSLLRACAYLFAFADKILVFEFFNNGADSGA